MKRIKTELEISFDNFYKLNKYRHSAYSILVSTLIVFILDKTIDFNIYFYLLYLILIYFILVKSLRKSLINRYVKRAYYLKSDFLSFTPDSIRVKYKDDFYDFKSFQCGFALNESYLFINTPQFRSKNGIEDKLFVINDDPSKLKGIYNSVVDHKKAKYKNWFFAGLISLSIIINLWKFDLYILNRFIKNEPKQWIVKSILKENMHYIDIDTIGLDYLGLKNNFSNDTSKMFSNVYFFNFRYEPNNKIRLLYGSGVTDNKIIDDLIQSKNILGVYNIYKNKDTLILDNEFYKLICVKK